MTIRFSVPVLVEDLLILDFSPEDFEKVRKSVVRKMGTSYEGVPDQEIIDVFLSGTSHLDLWGKYGARLEGCADGEVPNFTRMTSRPDPAFIETIDD